MIRVKVIDMYPIYKEADGLGEDRAVYIEKVMNRIFEENKIADVYAIVIDTRSDIMIIVYDEMHK